MHEASFELSEFLTWLSMSVVRWIISECWCMIWETTVIFVKSSASERKRQIWIFKSLKLYVNCIIFFTSSGIPIQFSFQWIGNVHLEFFTVRCLSCCVYVLWFVFFKSWSPQLCDRGIFEKDGREAPMERFYSNIMQVRLQNMKTLLESI